MFYPSPASYMLKETRSKITGQNSHCGSHKPPKNSPCLAKRNSEGEKSNWAKPVRKKISLSNRKMWVRLSLAIFMPAHRSLPSTRPLLLPLLNTAPKSYNTGQFNCLPGKGATSRRNIAPFLEMGCPMFTVCLQKTLNHLHELDVEPKSSTVRFSLGWWLFQSLVSSKEYQKKFL